MDPDLNDRWRPEADAEDVAPFVACDNCSRVWYYERAVCPDCHTRSFTRVRPRHGTIVARTTVHVTPEGVPQPLALGLVSYPEGGHVLGQLTDDSIERGDAVVLAGDHELRRAPDGDPITGPKIHPAERIPAETDGDGDSV